MTRSGHVNPVFKEAPGAAVERLIGDGCKGREALGASTPGEALSCGCHMDRDAWEGLWGAVCAPGIRRPCLPHDVSKTHGGRGG